MIDFRFHVSSLVAIFLALGIGILVGITMLGDEILVREQKVIVDRLERDFNLLREQNRLSQKEIAVFRDSNNNYQLFAQEVLPTLVQNKLSGQEIALVVTNGYSGTESLERSLKQAGANIVSVSRINGSFNFEDQNAKNLICENLSLGTVHTNAQFVSQIAIVLAQAIMDGIDPSHRDFLEEVSLASLQGSHSPSLDIVILLGGSQQSRDSSENIIDLPLIDYFLERGLQVVGTEFSQVTNSYMGLYQSKKIITVDNIDTAPGQVALILALNDLPGNYGIKSTADDLIPPLQDVAVGSEFEE